MSTGAEQGRNQRLMAEISDYKLSNRAVFVQNSIFDENRGSGFVEEQPLRMHSNLQTNASSIAGEIRRITQKQHYKFNGGVYFEWQGSLFVYNLAENMFHLLNAETDPASGLADQLNASKNP